jgi:hypothetical protein
MAKAKFGVPGLTISGRLGGAVIVPMADGRVIVRDLPERKVPPTAKQTEAAARLRPVAEAWHALSLTEVEAWRAFAKSPPEPHPYPSPRGGGRFGQGGGEIPLKPYNAFTMLAAKCLQMRPGAPVPTLPPTTGFMGDGIQVNLRFSIDDLRLREGSEVGSGAIVFEASGPNSAGVVTELLLQKLKSRNRMPSAKDYRTQRFVAFAAGSLESTVPVEPGAYACAIRFVREATGQETALVPLGLMEVA